MVGVLAIALSFYIFASTNDNPNGPSQNGHAWGYFVLAIAVVCFVAVGVLSGFAWGIAGSRIRLSRLESTARRWEAELAQSGAIRDLHDDEPSEPTPRRWMVISWVALGLAIAVRVCLDIFSI